jgi:hypothetical protein
MHVDNRLKGARPGNRGENYQPLRLAPGEGEIKLFDVLLDLATRSLPCPVTSALASLVGCSDGSIPGLLRKLVGDEKIRVRVENHPAGMGNVNRFRVVEIVGTALSTAMRPAGARNRLPSVQKSDSDLDRAKNFIRSRGPTVCAAYVYDNRTTPRGPHDTLICVDGEAFTPDQVMAFAEKLGMPVMQS